MENLLLIERYVLESLAENIKPLEGISTETYLPDDILSGVLESLIEKKLVVADKIGYALAKDKLLETIKIEKNEKNEKQGPKWEVYELFQTYFDLIFSQGTHDHFFRLQKIYLNAYDQILLEQHLKKLDDFFQEVKQRGDQHYQRDKKVIFYGHGDYLQLIDTYLSE